MKNLSQSDFHGANGSVGTNAKRFVAPLAASITALLLTTAALAQTSPARESDVQPPAQAGADATTGETSTPDSGLLYGTVSLEDGRSLTGTLRWGEQEATWTHHFNGNKASAYDLAALPDDAREVIEDNLPGPRFDFNGHVVELVRWLGSSELQPQFFSMEFGHIAELEPQGGERVTLRLRDGSTLEADGGSDDIGADIEIMTAPGQAEEVDWDDVEQVRFHAPASTPPPFPRYLYGRVQARTGTFEGYVDWDQDERYPDDELDGDVDGNERSVRFSTIANIKNEGESSLVTLKDGTVMSMSDTNDVNSDNRGIVVYSEALGKVMVPWSAFEEVSYMPAPTDQMQFDDYANFSAIRARVISDDTTMEGTIAYDLDQTHVGEMIRGKDQSGVQFEIPWRVIRRLTRGDNAVDLTLIDGRQLALGKDPDVTGSNVGIAVNVDQQVAYVPWERLKQIDLLH